MRITTPGIAGVFNKIPTGTDNSGTVIVGTFAWQRVIEGDYLDSWWAPPLNVSDAASVYQNIANVLPEGGVLRCTTSGTRILGQSVVFPRDFIRVICEPGVKFKQKDDTLSINTLIDFSGDYCDFYGLDVDGNVAGNATSNYIGRGEIVKFSGNRPTIKNSVIRNTHVKNLACGFYVTGKDSVIEGVTCFSTGRVAIRDRGNRTTVRDVCAYDIVDATRFTEPGSPNSQYWIGNRVIGKDGADENNSFAFDWVRYENIYGHSSGSSYYSTVVVDDSTRYGGRVICENITCDYPNATGPDVIKFVNFRRVDIRGLSTFNGGSGKSVYSVRVDNPGDGYMSAPTISFVGDGTGAQGTVVIHQNKVQEIIITDHGKNYTSPPTIVFNNTGTGGSGASATSIMGTNSCLRFQRDFIFQNQP